MKGVFLILLLAGFGYWVYMETEKEKELQTSLDETRLELQDAQKQLQAAQLQLAKFSGASNKSWMWDKYSSPLGTPAASGMGQHK